MNSFHLHIFKSKLTNCSSWLISQLLYDASAGLKTYLHSLCTFDDISTVCFSCQLSAAHKSATDLRSVMMKLSNNTPSDIDHSSKPIAAWKPTTPSTTHKPIIYVQHITHSVGFKDKFIETQNNKVQFYSIWRKTSMNSTFQPLIGSCITVVCNRKRPRRSGCSALVRSLQVMR